MTTLLINETKDRYGIGEYSYLHIKLFGTMYETFYSDTFSAPIK